MDSMEYLCEPYEVKEKAKYLRGALEHMLKVRTTMSETEIRKHALLNDGKNFWWYFTSPHYLEFPETKAFSQLNRRELAELEWALRNGYVHVVLPSTPSSSWDLTEVRLVKAVKAAILHHIKCNGTDETNFGSILNYTSVMYRAWQWSWTTDGMNWSNEPYQDLISCWEKGLLNAVLPAFVAGTVKLVRRSDADEIGIPLQSVSMKEIEDTIYVEARIPAVLGKPDENATREAVSTHIRSVSSIEQMSIQPQDNAKSHVSQGLSERTNPHQSLLEELQREMKVRDDIIEAREAEVNAFARRNNCLTQQVHQLETRIIRLENRLPNTEPQCRSPSVHDAEIQSSDTDSSTDENISTVMTTMHKGHPMLAILLEEKAYLEKALQDALKRMEQLSIHFELATEGDGLQEDVTVADQPGLSCIRRLKDHSMTDKHNHNSEVDDSNGLRFLRSEVDRLKEAMTKLRAEHSARENYLQGSFGNVVKEKQELSDMYDLVRDQRDDLRMHYTALEEYHSELIKHHDKVMTKHTALDQVNMSNKDVEKSRRSRVHLLSERTSRMNRPKQKTKALTSSDAKNLAPPRADPEGASTTSPLDPVVMRETSLILRAHAEGRPFSESLPLKRNQPEYSARNDEKRRRTIPGRPLMAIALKRQEEM